MFAFDSTLHIAIAFAAAAIAGVANAIAGGGTVVAFPALVWLGLPYVAANATNSVALWPGSISAAWSYRARLASMGRIWLWMMPVALAGGALGAWLLIQLPPAWFRGVAPFLVVGASIAVAIEPFVRRRLGRSHGHAIRFAPAATGLFAVSLYGGYFGAGIGILMLLLFSSVGVDSLHDANALKNVFAAVMKVSAIVYFIAVGAVVWPATLAMAAGAALGGYVGAALIQRVDEKIMRAIVVAIGVAMGIGLLLRS